MAATQPPAKARTAHTMSTSADVTGRSLVFFNPAQGTAMGTQQAKAGGGSALQTGGPRGTPAASTGLAATVLSDLLAADLANPTFSDRVATDADVLAPSIIPSGAVNPPR